MTKDALIEQLNDLEWEDFEVKEAKGEVPASSWETVSAFSNSSGGWLIFGVKQKGLHFEIVKMSNPEKVEQDFLNVLRSGQKFNVTINPTCIKYTVDGATVLGFYIPVSSQKPVYFNTQSNTFIRRGSADQRATQAEIDAMFRDQTFGTKSSELAIGTNLADLKEKSIREYRDYMSRFNAGVSYNRMELDDFLIKMRIIDRASKQCTYAGLLFFGVRESVEQFFADFRIDLLEIPGTSYQDASSRYTFRLSEDDYDNLWEAYFECFKRLRKQIDVTFKLTSEGFGEELSSGLLAIREALVNMLMHADYFAPSKPRIRIFNNHVEYYNAGGLPKPLKDLKGNDLSIPRNPILAKLFRMVKLAENAGYGFDKIDHNWKTYNQSEPVYIIAFDSTIVQLMTQAVDGSKTDKAIKKEEVISEQSRNKVGIMWESIQKEFGTISDRLLQSPEENKRFLQNIYETYAAAIQNEFGRNSEEIRKKFGKSSEEIAILFNETGIMILLLIKIDAKVTAKQMATLLGLTSRSIEKQIAKLKQHTIISRIGSNKSGYWKLDGVAK